MIPLGGSSLTCLAVGYTQQNGNSIAYPLHASTPSGEYNVRINGTIYDGSTPLSHIVSRSRTFNITLVNSFQCQHPIFTPVRSIVDPYYSPLRLAMPNGGVVFLQSSLDAALANITGTLSIVDASFDTTDLAATLELVNIATGCGTVAQSIPQSKIDARRVVYTTGNNITLAAGTWKLRMNFTSPSTGNTAQLTCESDEFYIVLDLPCVGLSGGSSTSMSASSTATPVISTSESASPSSASAPSGSREGRELSWNLLSILLSVHIMIMLL
ncbi:hypothetical protein B0H19DRAFT_710711 [Mycena capillaripes]|nr:hypothetical protein B0H19DRAFT_710711 [Mycena capillaripes]